jgi:hypothetical protein
MASEAQVPANRSNTQKSAGPRTPEGKAVVSQNAVKHGLLAQEVVIKGEDPGEFEFYRDRMLMYERRIEHSLYRTMGELRKQRLMREAEPATAEAGLVRSMGVSPRTTDDIHGQDARGTHGRDGRATNGRDAHATRPPEGGTPNESCETNPICTGSNAGQVPCGTEVRNDPSQDGRSETNPIPWGQAIAAGTTPRTMEAVVGACVDP